MVLSRLGTIKSVCSYTLLAERRIAPSVWPIIEQLRHCFWLLGAGILLIIFFIYFDVNSSYTILVSKYRLAVPTATKMKAIDEGLNETNANISSTTEMNAIEEMSTSPSMNKIKEEIVVVRDSRVHDRQTDSSNIIVEQMSNISALLASKKFSWHPSVLAENRRIESEKGTKLQCVGAPCLLVLVRICFLKYFACNKYCNQFQQKLHLNIAMKKISKREN